MNELLVEAAPHPAVVYLIAAQLRAAVDACLAVDTDRLSRHGLLAVVRDVEVQRRRLPVLDQLLVAAVESRRVPITVGLPRRRRC